MPRFLQIAYQVLLEVDKALSSGRITEIALENGYLRTSGLTPHHSMRARLSTDILKKKDASQFMRVESDCFALRKWKNRGQVEYKAPRQKKSLLDEEIIVFNREVLSLHIDKPGFHRVEIENGRELLQECFPMVRYKAEDDTSVIQIISVFLVRMGSKYFTHKRTKRLPEKRLHGFYSMFFGGHLNPEDIPTLYNIFNPEHGKYFLTRELKEEIQFNSDRDPEIEYAGLLYDDSRDVSKQHIGLVFDVFPYSMDFEIGERGFLIDPKFETLASIQSREADFENWSNLLCNTLLQEKHIKR